MMLMRSGTSGTQKCVLLVDCWWGWLDAEFREWLKEEHPYVLLLFVPACCTPVGQPNDAGIIAIFKGEFIRLFQDKIWPDTS